MQIKAKLSVLLWIYIFTALAVGLMGCASNGTQKTSNGADLQFITDSYKSLDIAGKSVDAAMTAIGTLYKAGQFSEDAKTRAIAADTAFQASYKSAVDALAAYRAAPSDATKQAAQVAMASVAVQVAAVVALNVINK